MAALVVNELELNKRMEPSGSPRATASAPIAPPAPGLFSTMTVVPSRALIRCAKARPNKSLLAPGEKGTISLISLGSGASCARAGAPEKPAASATTVVRNSNLRLLATTIILHITRCRSGSACVPAPRSPRPGQSADRPTVCHLQQRRRRPRLVCEPPSPPRAVHG